jgi:2-polyprenyl-6-methoxyphenol hydroxylase-like FAD-dependent oxidoreductase
MAEAAVRNYNAPQITIHRADLLEALTSRLPAGVLTLEKRRHGGAASAGACVRFADGTQQAFDLVIGADGIHSVVRAALFEQDHPEFTGLVSFRATIAREKVAQLPNIDAFTKWWGRSPRSRSSPSRSTVGASSSSSPPRRRTAGATSRGRCRATCPSCAASTRTSIPRHARCSTPAPR